MTHVAHVAAIVSCHGDGRHLNLCGREDAGGSHGGVVEQGRPVALPTAFPSVTVDSCLELAWGAEPPLLTFVGIEVLHVSAQQPGPMSLLFTHHFVLLGIILTVNNSFTNTYLNVVNIIPIRNSRRHSVEKLVNLT